MGLANFEPRGVQNRDQELAFCTRKHAVQGTCAMQVNVVTVYYFCGYHTEIINGDAVSSLVVFRTTCMLVPRRRNQVR